MKKLKCVIIDDEELARVLIESYIDKVDHLEVVGRCKNPMEALKLLRTTPADVLFLDVQMPELTGIEFLKTLEKRPDVIIVSAYAKYAIDGFDLNVVDYLLKPPAFNRFLKAVQKLEALHQSEIYPSGVETAVRNPESRDYILIQSNHQLIRLPHSDILYLESLKEYVAFHTTAGSKLLCLQSLKKMNQLLPASQFIRVHRSYIVAKRKVEALKKQHLVIAKKLIPIGASYKDDVMQELFT